MSRSFNPSQQMANSSQQAPLLANQPFEQAVSISAGGFPLNTLYTNNPWDTQCPNYARILTNVANGPKSKPGTPVGFKNWIEEDKDLVRDPVTGNALTQMHAINSHLAAENNDNAELNNNPQNIFLGTAASNDHHSAEAENKIKKWINDANPLYTRYVDYVVQPSYDSLPTYITERINEKKVTDPEIAGKFQVWASHAIPSHIVCNATYYEWDIEQASFTSAEDETLKIPLDQTKRPEGYTFSRPSQIATEEANRAREQVNRERIAREGETRTTRRQAQWMINNNSNAHSSNNNVSSHTNTNSNSSDIVIDIPPQSPPVSSLSSLSSSLPYPISIHSQNNNNNNINSKPEPSATTAPLRTLYPNFNQIIANSENAGARILKELEDIEIPVNTPINQMTSVAMAIRANLLIGAFQAKNFHSKK